MEDVLNKIKTIIEENGVVSYFITSSKNFKIAKRNLIKIQGFKSCDILKENLTPREALILKQNLYEHMQQNRDSVFYQKYHRDKRAQGFKPSLGGIDKDIYANITIGMAWE